ncbi:MAG: HlyC/CorC family transporter [Lachnospiraceae bacterium]|nr:HlyC/CorC family transporter [Lachnospiraceae bacterium]
MDDGGPTASLFVFLILLFADVLFYGFWGAVGELNSKELSDQYEETGSKKAKWLYDIVTNSEQYLNTLQLVISLVNLIMGGFFLRIFGNSMGRLLEQEAAKRLVDFHISPALLSGIAFVISGGLLLYIILTFGVLIPKKLGTKYASVWAFTFVGPIYYITKMLSPITGLVQVTAKAVLRIFGIHWNDNSEDVTEEEIISMVNEGHEQGVLLATEAEMITNIFEFGDKEAQDIMTHRKNMLAMDREMTLEEALDYMLSESKSRFPVYEENIDHIIGILHFRDVIRAHKIPGNLQRPVGEIEGLLRDVMFVPETKNIDDLFKNMQQTKTQMVIVVDEYGQTSGLIAMEDILEEIVGNIMDEYDEDEEYIEETENDNEYLIDGITPLEELEERFEISFHEEEFETLNGFLISKMDKIPEEDEEFSIDVDGYNFKILSVEQRVIKSVLVTKLPDEEEEEAEETNESDKETKQE